jgi:hypothetical protein
MDVCPNEKSWKYTYTLKPGISEVKGGLKVLHDMNYPQEIMDKLEKKNKL